MNNSKEKPLKPEERGVAGKKLSEAEMARLKKSLVKPVFKQTQKEAAAPAPAGTCTFEFHKLENMNWFLIIFTLDSAILTKL